MDTLVDAVLLKENATRTQIAVVYSILGALVGVLILAKKD